MEKEKCAFTVYAKGERHELFKQNVIQKLKKHVPDVAVIELSLEEALPLIDILPDADKPYFVRMAIPIIERLRKYDRVIWIDVDVDIVSDDFAEILEVETGEDGLAAAEDFMPHNEAIAYMRRMFHEYNQSIYFNSGVMVFDLPKIDPEQWATRALSGIKRWLPIRSKLHDQDVFNLVFKFNVIGNKFNSFWRRPAHNSAAIHFVDDRGKRFLNAQTDPDIWKRRCIVTSLRHRFIRPWIRAYFKSNNQLPLIIIPNPSTDWRDGDLEFCQAAAKYTGGMIFDCTEAWSRSKSYICRSVKKGKTNVGWYTKKLLLHSVASRLAPSSWVWIDDDAELTQPIDACFDEAERAPGSIFAQFYYHNAKDRQHPNKFCTACGPDKMFWGSMVFYHMDANRLLSQYLAADFDIEDDEVVFTDLYKRKAEWRDVFCDFPTDKWQLSIKDVRSIPGDFRGALLHYCSDLHNNEVKNYWAAKAYKLPPAPFEAMLSLSSSNIAPNNPIDAVFVIGRGSHHNNEELRYALRNLDSNCKFIRNVYIVGECPSWVDKTQVTHLKWPDRFNHAKDANIIDKLRHACEYPGISKNILFCSDDQFQTRECVWEDFYPRYLRQFETSDKYYEQKRSLWHSRLGKTLMRDVQRRKEQGLDTSQVYFYEPHIYSPIDRDKFIEYANWCDYQHRDDTITLSGYYNFVNEANGEPAEGQDHIFLSSRDKDGIPGVTHVAYDDNSYNVALRILKKMFPSKSRFELQDNTKGSTPNPHVQAKPGRAQDSRARVHTTAYLEKVHNVVAQIGEDKSGVFSALCGDVAIAEELRLSGYVDWPVLWDDVLARYEIIAAGGVLSARAQVAEDVIANYRLRCNIHGALRARMRN